MKALLGGVARKAPIVNDIRELAAALFGICFIDALYCCILGELHEEHRGNGLERGDPY